ncbi:RimJ/RimL family protein N-acetyltransferase [Nocardiopsis sp. Huas11]|uniref:GNAT family N-acetyltransferase n=1 Tax=Nocardiopsis sp. Huas11 TaxID=2183912 RepID=UPI000EAEC052|nr:GNAT family N-acetyltransferase [Nocardiopsis sp. Huas11]RKS07736.1 RimJ/RimL family protein N-acetyltransferase [Nocardiopsis sp. Huas11]
MALWRIRTAVEDRPGGLAGVVGVLADRGGDIVGLSVHTDVSGVVDEFVVEVPGRHDDLVRALSERCPSGAVTAVPAHRREVGDDVTRALLLTARLRAHPNRLPDALAELLLADDARWTNLTSADDAGQARTAPGTAMLVPVGPLRGVLVTRSSRPFTWTESSRAEALVRSVMPATGPVPTDSVVHTSQGLDLSLRQVVEEDAPALRELHRRCSAETVHARYLTGMSELSPRMLRVFCDTERGLTLAVRPRGREEPVALGHLMYTLDPGVGEIAFLVEDVWQGIGVGTALVRALTVIAAEWGLAEVRAETTVANAAMLRIMRRCGASVRTRGGTYVHARLPVAEALQAGLGGRARRGGEFARLMGQG